jgi:hypothetical protein
MDDSFLDQIRHLFVAMSACFWPTADGHYSIKINDSYREMHASAVDPLLPLILDNLLSVILL